MEVPYWQLHVDYVLRGTRPIFYLGSRKAIASAEAAFYKLDGKFSVETNEHGETELIHDGGRLAARKDKLHGILSRLHIHPITREHVPEGPFLRLFVTNYYCADAAWHCKQFLLGCTPCVDKHTQLKAVHVSRLRIIQRSVADSMYHDPHTSDDSEGDLPLAQLKVKMDRERLTVDSSSQTVDGYVGIPAVAYINDEDDGFEDTPEKHAQWWILTSDIHPASSDGSKQLIIARDRQSKHTIVKNVVKVNAGSLNQFIEDLIIHVYKEKCTHIVLPSNLSKVVVAGITSKHSYRMFPHGPPPTFVQVDEEDTRWGVMHVKARTVRRRLEVSYKMPHNWHENIEAVVKQINLDTAAAHSPGTVEEEQDFDLSD